MGDDDMDGLTESQQEYAAAAYAEADGGATMPPPIANQPTPDHLKWGNHPLLQNPLAGDAGGGGGSQPLMPAQQPSGTSAVAAQISGLSVGALAAAAATSASSSSGPPAADVDANAGGNDGGKESTDDESEKEDTRTEEQKEQDEMTNAAAAVITRVEAARYTFTLTTKWATVTAFLDAKELFDDESLDITSCAKGEKKKIGLHAVKNKIAELRKAAADKRQEQRMVPAGGESQFKFGSDNEGEGDEDDEGDATLTARATHAAIASSSAFSPPNAFVFGRTAAEQPLAVHSEQGPASLHPAPFCHEVSSHTLAGVGAGTRELPGACSQLSW